MFNLKPFFIYIFANKINTVLYISVTNNLVRCIYKHSRYRNNKKNMFSNRLIGQTAERLAEKYLTDKSYLIIKRNYQTRHGEIDIVCKKNKTLIFVEVKMRSNLSAGLPEEAITKAKKDKLILVAEQFITDFGQDFLGYRFDAISIILKKGNFFMFRFFI